MLFIMIEHYKWDDVRVAWFHGGTKLRDYKDKVMDVHFNRILWEIWSYGVTGFWECIKVFDSDGHGLFRIKDFGWFVCKDVWMAILRKMRAIEEETQDLDVEIKQRSQLKASYGVTTQQETMMELKLTTRTQSNRTVPNVDSRKPSTGHDTDISFIHHNKRHELPEEDTDFVSEDESETGDQKLINYTRNDKPFRPKPQPEDEELSFDDDPNNWLKTKMERCICRRDKEDEKDALIAILKSLVAKCKAVYANKDTVDLSDDMQEPEVEHREVKNLEKITSRWHVLDTMLSMGKEKMECSNNGCAFRIMTNFLKIRYENKTINDITRERRYYELVARNSEFKDNDSSHEAMIFDVRADYGKTHDDPYSRRFDEYRKGTSYPWHDEGFEEEERWESGIEKTDYEPPFVEIETFKIKRYSFTGGRSFICITKQSDDALPLGRE
ncbi:hypothetical protein Tco_0759729 [Tanacetum coccineum]